MAAATATAIGQIVQREAANRDTRHGIESAAWIDELLAKLHAIYGQSWVRHMDGVPYAAQRATWGEALAHWTKADAKAALDHCRDTMPFPPTLPEFIAARRAGSTAEQRAFAARVAADAQLALPSKTWAERRAEGRAAMAGLMSRLAERGSADVLAAINVQAPATDVPGQRAGPDQESPGYMALIERRKREALEALARMEQKTKATAERDTRGFDAPAETTRG